MNLDDVNSLDDALQASFGKRTEPDYDAIRARHVPAPPVPGYPLICAYCGAAHLWRCDTAIVLAALDGLTFDAKAFAEVVVQRDRATDAFGEANGKLLAALERERRLRELIGPVRIRSANCRADDHDECLGMVEQDEPGLGITDCLCDCHFPALATAETES